MSQQTLLVELGCEELPAGQLREQARLFGEGVFAQLVSSGLTSADAPHKVMATPRRLAVLIEDVESLQPTQKIERKGPAVSASFDDQGQPTAAALGFAKSVGLEVDALERISTDQGEWLAASVEQPGMSLAEVLAQALVSVTQQMAGARSMRWMLDETRFLRPVRWLVALHGSSVVEVSLFGLAATHTTQGHRVHAPGPCVIAEASAYEATLKQAFVLADMDARKNQIESQVEGLAKQHNLIPDPESKLALIEENAQLTEWPVAIVGQFDEAFLSVPDPALISAMQHHQKCFPLRHGDDQTLSAHFIAVANIESTHVDAMREGFERVIRPRLADAQFFWTQDLKTPLPERQAALDAVLFQKDLGSIGEKVARMEQAAPELAESLDLNVDDLKQVVRLCKCDLLTEMVGEFPELQGIMGQHYAKHAGETDAIASAIGSHYQPKHAGDALPETELGQAASLLDRADTLVGIFGVGLKPKGSKDPFALRRSALGLIRILEQHTTLSLGEVLTASAQPLAQQLGWDEAKKSQGVEEVSAFCLDRWRSHIADQGVQTNAASAALATPMTSVADLSARAIAISGLQAHPAIDQLIAANKRLANLLERAEQPIDQTVDEAALVEAQEKALFKDWKNKQAKINTLIDAADYIQALGLLAELATPLDAFFEHVMVMSDDATLKTNRLALLNEMRQSFLRVGDLAQLGL